MLIGTLASKSGLSRDTIRYYEKIDLIQTDNVSRLNNNYKNYQPKVLLRLNHISKLKHLGFTLIEIKNLLDLFEGSQPCHQLPQQLETKIALIDQKITQLKQFKNSLLSVQQDCDGKCSSSGGIPDCFITQ